MTSPRSSSTEVASRVHRVPLIGATAYVILEDEITVIDAGLRGSLPRLHAWITSVGRSPQEVRRFVITHAHPDHIGGGGRAHVPPPPPAPGPPPRPPPPPPPPPPGRAP